MFCSLSQLVTEAVAWKYMAGAHGRLLYTSATIESWAVVAAARAGWRPLRWHRLFRLKGLYKLELCQKCVQPQFFGNNVVESLDGKTPSRIADSSWLAMADHVAERNNGFESHMPRANLPVRTRLHISSVLLCLSLVNVAYITYLRWHSSSSQGDCLEAPSFTELMVDTVEVRLVLPGDRRATCKHLSSVFPGLVIIRGSK